MSEYANMEIDKVELNGQLNKYCSPCSMRSVLDANWTVNFSFYRPYGIKRRLPINLRSIRARLTLNCKGLRRKVFIKGTILIKGPYLTNDSVQIFQNLFEEGNSSFDFDIKLERLSSNDSIFDYRTYFYNISPGFEFKCELIFHVSPENYFYFKFGESHLPSESDLQDNRLQILTELEDSLNVLYQKQEDSDVKLSCGSQDFKAHKVILSSRSAVFHAMLHSAMKESEKNVIVIENMSPTTLESVLQYIYSGKVVNLNDSTVADLLSAAEQYELLGLKKTCIYYLQSSISVDNVLCTITLADLYDENLKKKAIDFVSKEFDHIKVTEEWKTFEKEKSALAYEVLLNIIDFAHLGKTKNC